VRTRAGGGEQSLARRRKGFGANPFCGNNVLVSDQFCCRPFAPWRLDARHALHWLRGNGNHRAAIPAGIEWVIDRNASGGIASLDHRLLSTIPIGIDFDAALLLIPAGIAAISPGSRFAQPGKAIAQKTVPTPQESQPGLVIDDRCRRGDKTSNQVRRLARTFYRIN
jgi:hypothetical protein